MVGKGVRRLGRGGVSGEDGVRDLVSKGAVYGNCGGGGWENGKGG